MNYNNVICSANMRPVDWTRRAEISWLNRALYLEKQSSVLHVVHPWLSVKSRNNGMQTRVSRNPAGNVTYKLARRTCLLNRLLDIHAWTTPKRQSRVHLRGVYSDTTQLNSTQLNSTKLTQLNSVQPSQSCFCLWRHDHSLLRSLIGDSCLRCERVDNSTSSWVELCRYKHPFTCPRVRLLNPLITKLKRQSNGPPYSNTIGTLAVDGWAVTFGTARRGLGGSLLFDVAL